MAAGGEREVLYSAGWLSDICRERERERDRRM